MVVNQPSAPPQTIHVVHNRANNHMVLTLVMMVLCFLHGNLPAFICLIPALCFAVVVSRHNKSNNSVNKQQARISKVNGRNNGSISWSGLVNLSAGKFHQSTRFITNAFKILLGHTKLFSCFWMMKPLNAGCVKHWLHAC